jgi:hypothetical protein
MKSFNSQLMAAAVGGRPKKRKENAGMMAAMTSVPATDSDFGRLVSFVATQNLMSKAAKEAKAEQAEDARMAAELANHKFAEKIVLARMANEGQLQRAKDKESSALERESRNRQWDLDKEARKESRLDKYNKLRFAEKEASRQRGYQEARDLAKDKQAARNDAFEQSLIAKSFADPMDYLKYKADPAAWSSKMVKTKAAPVRDAWEYLKGRAGFGSSYKPKIKTKLKD